MDMITIHDSIINHTLECLPGLYKVPPVLAGMKVVVFPEDEDEVTGWLDNILCINRANNLHGKKRLGNALVEMRERHVSFKEVEVSISKIVCFNPLLYLVNVW